MTAGPGIGRALVAFALIAVLGLGGLALAAAADQRDTAFSLQVPNSEPVVVVAPGHRVCQAPVLTSAAVRGAQLWLGPVSPPGTSLRLSASSADGAALGSGTLSTPAASRSSPRIWLDHAIPTGVRLRLCFDNVGRAQLSLIGGPAGPYSGTLEQGGHRLGSAAAVVMLSPHPRSMLSLLPTIFGRAALFRPSWVGSWAYWVLVIAIAGAFPLAAAALRLAAREDSRP